MYVVKRGFYFRSGDKVFVDVYCGKGFVRICVIGIAKKPRGGRRIAGVYDRLLVKLYSERGGYLECFERRVQGEVNIVKTLIDDKQYLVVEVSRDLYIYFPAGKIDYLKKCLKEIVGSRD